MADFQYQPLNSIKQEIRLLRFRDESSTTSHGRLSFTVEPASLVEDPLPEYVAVSYCWGEGTKPRKRIPIQLNDCSIGVPQGAWAALSCILASEHRSKAIWIDSVCINQKDDAERSQQVAMMSDVYGKACRVIVYLGEADGSTASALSSIHTLLEQCKAQTSNYADFKQTIWTEHDASGHRYRSFTDSGLPDGLDWDALSKFYQAPWFQRLWVVQEVSLAQEATCYRGQYAIEWIDVSRVAVWLHYKRYRTYMRNRNIHGIGNASRMWVYARKNSHDEHGTLTRRSSLSSLLHLGLRFKATDPRDRIFGLLGLTPQPSASGGGADLPSPDYRQTLKQVYCSATRAAIYQDAANGVLLQVLSYTGGRANSQHNVGGPDWPSWVPQWHIGFNPPKGSYSRIWHVFCANDRLPIALEESQHGPEVLRLQGVVIDVVTTVVPMLYFNTTNERVRPAWDRILTSVLTAAESEHHMERSGSLQSAIATTLVAGSINRSPPIQNDPVLDSSFAAFVEQQRNHPSAAIEDSVNCNAGSTDPRAEAYLAALNSNGANRDFFTTDTGRIGLGPPGIKSGDRVSVLLGGATPFILREEPPFWKLIGDSYVHGVMWGEAIAILQQKRELHTQSQWFDIH